MTVCDGFLVLRHSFDYYCTLQDVYGNLLLSDQFWVKQICIVKIKTISKDELKNSFHTIQLIYQMYVHHKLIPYLHLHHTCVELKQMPISHKSNYGVIDHIMPITKTTIKFETTNIYT